MIVGVGHDKWITWTLLPFRGQPSTVSLYTPVTPHRQRRASSVIMARKNAKGTKESPNEPVISEQEQWRIINETGLLKQLPNSPRTTRVEEEETPFAEEILNAMLLIAPFTFLLVMMDM